MSKEKEIPQPAPGVHIFDSHAHLGWEKDPEAQEQLIKRAAEFGVTQILDVGIDLCSSTLARERAKTCQGIYASAGLHPNDCIVFEEEWPELEALGRTPEVVAIGETGLDFYRDRVPEKEQVQALEAHLELGRKTGKPVILHCREAFPRLVEVLDQWAPVHGILHCFTAGPDEARACLDLGLYVSFAGPLTYKKNESLREAAALIPDELLLTETDAPFLSPQGKRGRRNEPAFIPFTIACMAEVRKTSFADCAKLCSKNAEKVFRL
jgi:TatD DNase family protein